MSSDDHGERRSYRKVYRRLWTDQQFLSLIDGERMLTLYLLTGPQTNRIGLFKLSLPMAAEDLGRPLQTVRRQFAKVIETFGWQWDPAAKVLWIPSWWKHNPPPKQGTNFKGLLADRNDLPMTPLRAKFDAHRAYVPAALHGAFASMAASSEPSSAQPVNGAQHASDPTALSTKQEAESTKHQAESRDAPSAPSACVLDASPPMDVWARELVNLYPPQGRCGWNLVERPLWEVLTADHGVDPHDAWAALKTRLESHKRSHQWRVKQMIPRLDRWLREGLHLQELPEDPPVAEQLAPRTNRTLAAAAAIMREGQR